MAKNSSAPNFDRIAKFRGEIKVGMLVRNDVIFVKVVKADLLYMIRGMDSAVEVFEDNDILYVTNS